MGVRSVVYLNVHYSDGTASTTTGLLTTVPNRPTDKQLEPPDNADGIIDYYRAVDFNSRKCLMWRLKLGRFIMEKQPDYNASKYYILRAWPTNYQLYEHVTRTAGVRLLYTFHCSAAILL